MRVEGQTIQTLKARQRKEDKLNKVGLLKKNAMIQKDYNYLQI
jgi:hypothetical protein